LIRDFKDCFEDAHMRERGFWVSIDHPEVEGTIDYPGAGFRLEKSPITLRHRAPLIGEHNHEIYEGELGLSREQMALLRANGVI
jgi:crotonobetainyl-CoA:carnitine CoA-transferase CaiB-like acyl-CoA transferase